MSPTKTPYNSPSNTSVSLTDLLTWNTTAGVQTGGQEELMHLVIAE